MATANLFPGLLKTPMGSSSSPQCRMCLFGRHWRMDTIGKQAEAHTPWPLLGCEDGHLESGSEPLSFPPLLSQPSKDLKGQP